MPLWTKWFSSISNRTNEKRSIRDCLETCALEVIGARFIRDVQPGEIVIINDEGIQIDCFTKDTQLSICSMEYIYFARPDSNIAGINVHTARKNMGRNLAKESPVKADMVVGVPNSSLSAASGYAEASGIPYEIGLVKINTLPEHLSSQRLS